MEGVPACHNLYPRRRRTHFFPDWLLPDWLFGVLFFFHGFEVTKRSIAKQSLEPGQAFKNYLGESGFLGCSKLLTSFRSECENSKSGTGSKKQ